MEISPSEIATMAKIEFGPENCLSKDDKEFIQSKHDNYPLSMRFTPQNVEKKSLCSWSFSSQNHRIRESLSNLGWNDLKSQLITTHAMEHL